MSVTSSILVGDAIERLAELPAGSTRCCVTSPPYWGLRDYGTAEWVGGDAGCDHAPTRGVQGATGQRADRTHTEGMPFREVCGRCGARRVDRQIGLEATPEAFVEKLVGVFRAVWRVLADDGTLWVNMGDSYTSGGRADFGPLDLSTKQASQPAVKSTPRAATPDGLKPKDLVGVPWMLAFALRADGWYLRSDNIWAKPNPMPESVRDRPTKAHEYVFLLSKSQRYFYDAAAIAEPAATGRWDAMPPIGGVKHAGSNGNATYSGNTPEGDGTRNARSVWTIATQPFPEAHFATFPLELPLRCIKAGTSERGKCPGCGAPWRRTVETEKTFESGSGRSGNPIAGKQDLAGSANNSTPDIRMGPTVRSRTTGWTPGCGCGREPVPDTVLDPFAGSGTTGEAAVGLGRNFVGCELNPAYAKLAEDRIGRALRPNSYRSDRETDAPLFTEATP